MTYLSIQKRKKGIFMSFQKKNTPLDEQGADMSGLCVPSRLKALRLHYELTQSDVAEVLNVSTREYWRLEQPNYCTRYINLFMLSVFYNVSLDYLFGLTNEQKELYDSSTYTGRYQMCDSSMYIIVPNVEAYKKQKADTKQ